MKLVELSVKDGKDVYDMLQRIGYDENAFRNDVHGMSYDQYTSWLNLQHSWSKGELLPNGYVRQWTYWLKTDENIPVGYGKLREQVTEESRCFGGNLGFAYSGKIQLCIKENSREIWRIFGERRYEKMVF